MERQPYISTQDDNGMYTTIALVRADQFQLLTDALARIEAKVDALADWARWQPAVGVPVSKAEFIALSSQEPKG